MQLQNQIEALNNPQEFTRLYNFVLSQEYGLDYLPIDDDQADRGNDGYLKAEKRIFAGHCFKRIQKQKLHDEIFDKMSSDLKKATVLKAEGVWEIDSWTFLSNYPIPEDVATKILKQGKQSDIDVSWRGPEYFANALVRYKEAADQFPNLVATDIQAKLDSILSSLIIQDKKEPLNKVPENSVDAERLPIEKPPYWSYLYFGGLLITGKIRLEEKWLNHRAKYARPSGKGYDLEEANKEMLVLFPQLEKTIDGLADLVNENSSVAFGSGPDDGDSDTIKFIANRILNAYEDMLDWAARIRASTYPSEYRGVFTTSAQMVDEPIKGIRDFIDSVYDAGNKIISHFSSDSKEEDLTLVLSLTLKVDEKQQEQFNREMEKLRDTFDIY